VCARFWPSEGAISYSYVEGRAGRGGAGRAGGRPMVWIDGDACGVRVRLEDRGVVDVVDVSVSGGTMYWWKGVLRVKLLSCRVVVVLVERWKGVTRSLKGNAVGMDGWMGWDVVVVQFGWCIVVCIQFESLCSKPNWQAISPHPRVQSTKKKVSRAGYRQ
jgi:hypothetical protein